MEKKVSISASLEASEERLLALVKKYRGYPERQKIHLGPEESEEASEELSSDPDELLDSVNPSQFRFLLLQFPFSSRARKNSTRYN